MMRALLAQHGLTLIELMIAMTLGLVIMLITTGVLLSSKAAYISQNQIATVQESGRYAVQLVSRAIRQSAYPPINETGTQLLLPAETAAGIAGRDAMTLKKTSAGLQSATSNDAVDGSDILALGYFGNGMEGKAGDMINCAGLIVPGVNGDETLESQRSWSIFFVARDSSGEPELRCKYRTENGWNADAVVRGVESFQVLYGIDASGDGIPDYFINASMVDSLDQRLPLAGHNAAERALDLQRHTYWKKVRAIRFSLLMRGSEYARGDALTDVHDLFDSEYSALFSATDKGVQIDEKRLPAKEKNRIRKIFSKTVYLRNAPEGGAQ